MKNLFIALIVAISISACSKDDNSIAINEEELITSVVITLTNNEDEIVLKFEDVDGDGPALPTYTASGNLDKTKTYNAEIALFNLDEEITNEIKVEGTDHQFFYQATNGFSATFQYLDFDDNELPIGLKFQISPSNIATNGNLNIILKHLPNKLANLVAQGDITQAGGSTDININFPIVVE